MAHPELIDAGAAAARLGVQKSTLYAYVSRGKVRSVTGPGRGHLYYAADVERLLARSAARTGHGPVAGHALRWGEPVLESSLSAIAPDGPYYRGRSALELARTGHSFESVAELLIAGTDGEVAPWYAPDLGVRTHHVRALCRDRPSPLGLLSLFVPALALGDAMRFGATDEAELERTRRMVPRMAAAVALARGRAPEDALRERTTAAVLARALLGVAPRAAVDAIERALVLIADHELNASTFAARVAASSGADLYACVSAGLAALSGPLHGAASDRVIAWLDRVRRPADARRAIAERTRRGEAIPGFGHPLYPDGDPRAVPLLELAFRLGRSRVELKALRAVIAAMERQRRQRPNVDLALAALGLALGRPTTLPTALFAVGRSAAFVAHSLEQRRAGFLVRPRAKTPD